MFWKEVGNETELSVTQPAFLSFEVNRAVIHFFLSLAVQNLNCLLTNLDFDLFR